MNAIKIVRDVYRDKRLLLSLSKNDFKTRFAGSYLGIIWAFIQPLVTIAVYWFVFEVGLRQGKQSDFPFILWLMSGLVPWFFFSEAWNGGTNSLIEYNYLVKKVVFNISILPVIKVISAFIVNLFFEGILIVLCWGYGYHPDLYTLQLIYYIFCMCMLVLGLSYFTSAVVGFFRDLTQLINIILQVGMWLTPILWNASVMLESPLLLKIFKLNPMYYIVEGFRDSLLAKVWFFEKPYWSIYFWVFTLLMFMLGTRVFNKLKVHFADVL